MMSSYKLAYFNLRGGGEVSRLLFALAGREYEDVRIANEDWPKIKPTTPLGQVPVLTIDGKDIPQQGAIQRYLAREFGLYGKDNMENTMCDVIMETFNDVKPIVREWVLTPDPKEKEANYKNLKETVLPKFIKFIERTLTDNGGEYLVGSGVTVADVMVYNFLDQFTGFFGDDIFDTSALVKAHVDKIAAIPQIHKWVKERPVTER